MKGLPPPTPKIGKKIEHHVHIDIAAQARELCLITYESVMQNNIFWRDWQRAHPGLGHQGLENAYVKRYLAAFVGAARAMLAGSLRTETDPALRERIHSALIADNFLTRGRDPKGWQK